MPVDVVEGWTGELNFTLKVDGTATNLTGATVTLSLTDRDGFEVATSGDVSIVTAASGTIKYAPDAADLLASGSPYRARFKVVDSSSLATFYPNGPGDEWRVHRP